MPLRGMDLKAQRGCVIAMKRWQSSPLIRRFAPPSPARGRQGCVSLRSAVYRYRNRLWKDRGTDCRDQFANWSRNDKLVCSTLRSNAEA